MFTKEQLADFVARTFGAPYARLNCWQVPQLFYRENGVDLPDDYYAALASFVVVDRPEPGDVIAIRNHPFVTNHCGLYVGDDIFLHSLETTGVATGNVTRRPWTERIAGFLRLK